VSLTFVSREWVVQLPSQAGRNMLTACGRSVTNDSHGQEDLLGGGFGRNLRTSGSLLILILAGEWRKLKKWASTS
jgi:hypothetical protein